MKVSIKDFKIGMELKNGGIELEIRDNQGEFLGDLIVNKKSLTWCKGKITKKNGIEVKWEDFISLMEGLEN